jgi:hypothetical protein
MTGGATRFASFYELVMLGLSTIGLMLSDPSRMVLKVTWLQSNFRTFAVQVLLVSLLMRGR